MANQPQEPIITTPIINPFTDSDDENNTPLIQASNLTNGLPVFGEDNNSQHESEASSSSSILDLDLADSDDEEMLDAEEIPSAYDEKAALHVKVEHRSGKNRPNAQQSFQAPTATLNTSINDNDFVPSRPAGFPRTASVGSADSTANDQAPLNDELNDFLNMWKEEMKKTLKNQRYSLTGYLAMSAFGTYLAIIFFGATAANFTKLFKEILEDTTGLTMPNDGVWFETLAKIGSIGSNVPFNSTTFIKVGKAFLEGGKNALKDQSRIKGIMKFVAKSGFALIGAVLGTLAHYAMMEDASLDDQILAGIQNTASSLLGVLGMVTLTSIGGMYYNDIRWNRRYNRYLKESNHGEGVTESLLNRRESQQFHLMTATALFRDRAAQLKALPNAKIRGPLLEVLKNAFEKMETGDIADESVLKAILTGKRPIPNYGSEAIFAKEAGNPQQLANFLLKTTGQEAELREIINFLNTLPFTPTPSKKVQFAQFSTLSLLSIPTILGLGALSIMDFPRAGWLTAILLTLEMTKYSADVIFDRVVPPALAVTPLWFKGPAVTTTGIFALFCLFSWASTGNAAAIAWGVMWAILGVMASTSLSNGSAMVPFMLNYMMLMYNSTGNENTLAITTAAQILDERIVPFVEAMATILLDVELYSSLPKNIEIAAQLRVESEEAQNSSSFASIPGTRNIAPDVWFSAAASPSPT